MIAQLLYQAFSPAHGKVCFFATGCKIMRAEVEDSRLDITPYDTNVSVDVSNTLPTPLEAACRTMYLSKEIDVPVPAMKEAETPSFVNMFKLRLSAGEKDVCVTLPAKFAFDMFTLLTIYIKSPNT